mgnify:CR=1 FL=1
MFDLYQLEQLLMIAERGTLSGAAEQQHLSQSALSRSMQRLEREIGVPLFLRRKNRIELNENGRLAVEYAKKILDQTHDMVAGIFIFNPPFLRSSAAHDFHWFLCPRSFVDTTSRIGGPISRNDNRL